MTFLISSLHNLLFVQMRATESHPDFAMGTIAWVDDSVPLAVIGEQGGGKRAPSAFLSPYLSRNQHYTEVRLLLIENYSQWFGCSWRWADESRCVPYSFVPPLMRRSFGLVHN